MLLCPIGGAMAKTRTPGITVLADGRLFIDKRYLGVRTGLRVGAVTLEYAEERLRVEMARTHDPLVLSVPPSHRLLFTVLYSESLRSPNVYPVRISVLTPLSRTELRNSHAPAPRVDASIGARYVASRAYGALRFARLRASIVAKNAIQGLVRLPDNSSATFSRPR